MFRSCYSRQKKFKNVFQSFYPKAKMEIWGKKRKIGERETFIFFQYNLYIFSQVSCQISKLYTAAI
jgi:hypothetical protein